MLFFKNITWANKRIVPEQELQSVDLKKKKKKIPPNIPAYVTIFLLLFQRWLFIKYINPSFPLTSWQDFCWPKGFVLPVCPCPIILTLPLQGIHARAHGREKGASAGVRGWTWNQLSCPIGPVWRGTRGRADQGRLSRQLLWIFLSSRFCLPRGLNSISFAYFILIKLIYFYRWILKCLTTAALNWGYAFLGISLYFNCLCMFFYIRFFIYFCYVLSSSMLIRAALSSHLHCRRMFRFMMNIYIISTFLLWRAVNALWKLFCMSPRVHVWELP